MQLKDNLTMIIHSCDKFSDLWDAHVSLLEKFWPDRNIPTYIVTDKENERAYERVSVIAAGEGAELSERTARALEEIDTEYVFITLDDYFLYRPVSNEVIGGLLDVMEKENLDYIRLFKYPRNKRSAINRPMKDRPDIWHLDNNQRYTVNLYAGIWRKSFLAATVREKKNAWQYEVSLSRIAREVNARCAMTNGKEFNILDGVRKGKFLHKAYRYLKKHDLYHGDRPLIGRWQIFKLNVRIWGTRHMPRCIVDAARNFMIKRGHHYFSQEE